MTRKNDKRARLIDAADELIYQQTFYTTTLADIATRADVPLGNVYYYFKTKDDILKAVLQKRVSFMQSQFVGFEQQPNVKDRLRAFLRDSLQISETIARFGCTFGSLCQELGKQGGDLATMGSELMKKTVDWVEAQFKNMGKGQDAGKYAEYFISCMQGAFLLTLTFKDPALLERQTKTLEDWLERV